MQNFTIFLFVLLTTITNAQNKVIGRVTDALTGEPIPYASAFMANTSIGTSTNLKGLFLIGRFPDGKYVLTITHIGYQAYQVSIDFDNTDEFSVEVALVPSTVTLPQLEINEDTTGRRAYLNTFKKFVIGISGNADQCVLMNPEKVHLYRDPQTRTLYAHSKEPLVIENRALGYRVIYWIDTFEYSSFRGRVYTFGIPRFEKLKPINTEEENKWIRNRQEVYLGSVMHFMRSLYQDELLKNGFELLKLDSIKQKKYDFTDSLHVQKMELTDSSMTNVVAYQGDLIVKFNRHKMDNPTDVKLKGNKKVESIMRFLDKSIFVYSNGEFENIKQVLYEGYWAQAETISNWLPYDYNLEEEKDK